MQTPTPCEPKELKAYTEGDDPQPWEAEMLIIKTILFFMQPEKWNHTQIEKTLFPGLIQYSHDFKGGSEP